MKKTFFKSLIILTLCFLLMACAVACTEDTDNLTDENLTNEEIPNNEDNSQSTENQHTHFYASSVIEATCDFDGYTKYTCECGHEYNDNFVNRLNHSFTSYKQNNDATCFSNATETAICDRKGCQQTNTRSIPNSTISHNFVNYIYDGNATCSRDGTKTAQCINDGCIVKDTVSALGTQLKHSFVDYISNNNATCMTNCTETARCSNSGCLVEDTRQIPNSTVDHKFEDYVSNNDATTEKDGTKTAICEFSGCNVIDTIVDIGSKLPTVHSHSYTAVVTKPTCTEQGYTTHTCSCNDSYIDSYIEANGHSYENGVCGVCGYFYVEGSEGLAYALSEDKSYYEVLGIGTCVDSDIIIPSSYGGKPIKSIVDYAFQNSGSRLTSIIIPNSISHLGKGVFSNCLSLTSVVFEDGSQLSSISNSLFFSCTNLTNIKIPANVISIGKDAFYWCNNLTDAYFEGTKCWYVSSVEGATSGIGIYLIDASQNATYLKKTYDDYYWYTTSSGHNYNSVITEATCDEQGYTIHTCDTCGDSYIDSYTNVNGHNYNSVITTPTCTEQGYTTYTCDKCGDSYVDVYTNIDLTNHDLVSHGGKVATCTNVGWSDYVTCNRCDYSTYQEIPIKGHHEVCHSGKAATCTDIGWNDYVTCDRCDYSTYKEEPLLNHTFVSNTCSLCNVHIDNFALEIYDVSANLDESILAYVVNNNTCIELYVFGIGNIKSYTSTNTPIYVDGYNIQITNAIFGNGITAIGDYFLYNCNNLTNLNLPNTIQAIGEYAFFNSDITSVELPASLTTIGQAAFYNNDKLSNINIPSQIAVIGANAFKGCTQLSIINFNNLLTMKHFGANAFSNTAYYNDELNWNGKILYLDGCLIASKTTISGELYIPNTVKVIADQALLDCTSLTKIVVPEETNVIGLGAFKGCEGLKFIQVPFVGATRDCTVSGNFGHIFGSSSMYSNGTYVPNSLEEIVVTDANRIDSYAFSGCSMIKTLTLPYLGTTKEEGCFLSNLFGGTSTYNSGVPQSLTTIRILAGKIKEYAFNSCSSLVNVIIGENVDYIGKGAFYNCSSIETIELPFVGESVNVSDGYKSVFGYVFGYGTKTYNNGISGSGGGTYWSTSDYDVAINQYTETYYGEQTQYYYKVPTAIKNVVLNGKSKIPSNAFYKCSMISSIVATQTEHVGQKAFYDCKKLERVDFGSIISIENQAFYNCTKLLSISLPATINSVSSNAFYNCTQLKYNVANNIKYLGNDENLYLVALGCEDKTKTALEIINGCILIGSGAFSGCDQIMKVVIPSSMINIGAQAFYNCRSLFEVYNLSNIEILIGDTSNGYVGYYAKECYSSLETESKVSTNSDGFILYTSTNEVVLLGYKGDQTNIVIPNVTKINQYAFYSQSQILSVTFSSNIVEIGDYAFYRCVGLTTIDLPNSIVRIGKYGFYGCSNLESVSLSKNLESIGESAFYNCKKLNQMTMHNKLIEVGDYAFYGLDSTFVLNYHGIQVEWNDLKSKLNGSNSSLKNATIVYVE